jgi:hypothetical protein
MADFITTDRSEMMVPATNSFLFLFCRDKQRINYLHSQRFQYPVMEFTANRLLC